MPASKPSTHNARRGVQRTSTAAATEANKLYTAERASEDPAKLARAIRIVRAALARKRISLDELTAK